MTKTLKQVHEQDIPTTKMWLFVQSHGEWEKVNFINGYDVNTQSNTQNNTVDGLWGARTWMLHSGSKVEIRS